MTETPTLQSLNVLTTEGVAEAAGLSVGSVRVMVTRARTRREQGRSLTTDLPAPDLFVYRSPLWRKSTITKWIKSRKAANLGVKEVEATPVKKTSAKKDSSK